MRPPRAATRLRRERPALLTDAGLSQAMKGTSVAENDNSEFAADARKQDMIGDTTPRKWDEVFDEQIMVTVDTDEFCCYTAGLDNNPGIVCLFLHGGGHCALSWGCVVEHVKSVCGAVAFDARGHGDTMCADVTDLSAEAQVADAAAVIRALFASRGKDVPDLVICGHSMGGAIAIRLSASGTLGSSVKGLVVIDVVEGTAMAALPYMRNWVQRRAQSFDSVEKGVRYVIKAGHVRNAASARLSVPRQLVYKENCRRWVWRTDLEKTSTFWHGWFHGLSQLFLSVPAAKLLLLAGIDRLDKDLTIAQMQGKFQNMLIPSAGHAVHEDQPEQTARVIMDYLKRNMFVDGCPTDEPGEVFQQRSPIPPCR